MACAFFLLIISQQTTQAKPSTLIFTSPEKLLVAHNSAIYCVDILTQCTSTIAFFSSRSCFDAIAYNENEQTIYATIRRGGEKLYNDLLVIPEQTPRSLSIKGSDYARIMLSPNGNHILTLKTQSKTQVNTDSRREAYNESLHKFSRHTLDLEIEKEINLQSTDLGEILYMELSVNTNTALIKTCDGKILLWNSESNFLTRLTNNLTGYRTIGTLSNDGQWAFVATQTTGRLLKIAGEINVHLCIDEPIRYAAFSSNSKYLIIISETATPDISHVAIFDLNAEPQEQPEATIRRISDTLIHLDIQFNSVALSPDGGTFATLSRDGKLQIIDVKTESIITKNLHGDKQK